jgi:hypothetical protein
MKKTQNSANLELVLQEELDQRLARYLNPPPQWAAQFHVVQATMPAAEVLMLDASAVK